MNFEDERTRDKTVNARGSERKKEIREKTRFTVTHIKIFLKNLVIFSFQIFRDIINIGARGGTRTPMP